MGILEFVCWLGQSKAPSWEIIIYCLTALLEGFVTTSTSVMIQRPLMGHLLQTELDDTKSCYQLTKLDKKKRKKLGIGYTFS